MNKRDLKEYNRKYYQEHKEEIMAKRAKRLEQRKEYHRKWREEHREEYNRYQMEYHRKQRAKKREKYLMELPDRLREEFQRANEKEKES